MIFFDTHCHPQLINDNSWLHKALTNGVTNMVAVSVDIDDVKFLANLASANSNIYYSIGSHPQQNCDLTKLSQLTSDYCDDLKWVAIGETGLDPQGNFNQEAIFREHIKLSIIYNKPLIVHSRDNITRCLDILSDYPKARGVMHCFTGSLLEAKRAIDLGFYISFSGILTFKNARSLHEVASQIPLENLVVETDSPYLTPHPYRGKHANEPAYLKYIVEALSLLKNSDLTTVANQLIKNSKLLFNIND